jgi:hypothetical protein
MASPSQKDYDVIVENAGRQPDGSYITSNGARVWYNEEGFYHREDGPACFYTDGSIDWAYNGSRYTFNEWCVAANISDEDKMMLRLQYG